MGQGRSKGNGGGRYWRDRSLWRFRCGFSPLFIEKDIRSKRNVFIAGKHPKNEEKPIGTEELQQPTRMEGFAYPE